MTVADAPTVLRTTAPANGGSAVARHDGRVVFVRHALPGETVRVRLTDTRKAFWHADAVEVLEASPHRIAPRCPIAGPDGAGCCDMSFVDPAALRDLKGEVVANQLARLGGHTWTGSARELPGGSGGWRTRVKLTVGADGRAGLHRHHSDTLVTDLRCGQLPTALVDGLAERRFAPGAQVHAALDDGGRRHVVQSGAQAPTTVLEGDYEVGHRVGGRQWKVPVTAFWQAHAAAPAVYSDLVRRWAQPSVGASAWDLYGGAGVFAAVLAEAVGPDGSVLSVDTSRGAARAARAALADLPQVEVVTGSVRQVLARAGRGAEVAVLDPPRAGAGRDVVAALSAAGVSRVVHIGCEVAAFARDVGCYRDAGWTVADIEVLDAFPLTHHVEAVALLVR